MWKPGTAKPGKSQSPKTTTTVTTPTTPKNHHQANKNICDVSQPSSANAKSEQGSLKRLSGTTLNMKFMKRKKEMEQHEERRKSGSMQNSHQKKESPSPSSNRESLEASASKKSMGDDPMDMEVNDEEVEDKAFSRATPADMYGVQASMIGRRSFGGFNPAMEEAWKDSKSYCLEGRLAEKSSKQKVSDEELLQRYQEIVQQRKDRKSTRQN